MLVLSGIVFLVFVVVPYIFLEEVELIYFKQLTCIFILCFYLAKN